MHLGFDVEKVKFAVDKVQAGSQPASPCPEANYITTESSQSVGKDGG